MVRVFLLLNAIFFLGFGVYAVLNAPLLAETLGMTDISSNGLYELRSNYGGVSLGAGIFFALATLRTNLQRPALFFLFVYTGGYALGRVLALPIDGIPAQNLIAFALFEAITASLALLLLRHSARQG